VQNQTYLSLEGDRKMTRATTEEEKQQAYETLVDYYEQAAPIIERVSDLNTFKYGELPLNPYMLVEAGITLKMMLHALRKLHVPHDRELDLIQREFDTALSNCIKAAEATEKYVEVAGTSRSHVILNIIINSTVMANEHMESVAKRLEDYRKKSISIMMLQPQPAKVKKESQEKVTRGWVTPKESEESYPGAESEVPGKNKPGGVIRVLDKIGDIIIYPIVKIADLSDAVRRSEDRDDK
jgi:hypothetical protein